MDVLKVAFFTVKVRGTVFTGMTPCFTHSGTTQLFSTHHSFQLALAHVILDACEARACSVVC